MKKEIRVKINENILDTGIRLANLIEENLNNPFLTKEEKNNILLFNSKLMELFTRINKLNIKRR